MHEEASSIYYDLTNNPPKFHFWAGQSRSGGFDSNHFEYFSDVLRGIYGNESGLKMIETGAGLSSLYFLCKNYEVHSFSLPDVINRIHAYLEKYPNIKNSWHSYPGFSEFTLPKFSEANRAEFDVAIIDGNHSVPSVFSDFIHTSFCLKNGGILILDDNQLPGPLGVSRVIEYHSNDFNRLLKNPEHPMPMR